MSKLAERVKWAQIFDKSAKMPETKDECRAFFIQIVGDLSPENLCCDGELNQTQVRAKLKVLRAEWKELEAIYGQKVSEEEAENWEIEELKLK